MAPAKAKKRRDSRACGGSRGNVMPGLAGLA
jgi:hypothetical protein